MPRNVTVPGENDVLCAHCGYGLNGLPDAGRCPECGEPIADSTIHENREPALWERDSPAAWLRFVRTAGRIIAAPGDFYRHLQTRTGEERSRAFLHIDHAICAILFGATAALHAEWMNFGSARFQPIWLLFTFLIFAPLTGIMLALITTLASFLTRWEGTYWGYRLPRPAVRRVMHYHSAQLLPVALVALLTVGGFRLLLALHVLSALAGVNYLIVLCVEVVVCAIYLFRTYWIAMKNIMFANR